MKDFTAFKMKEWANKFYDIASVEEVIRRKAAMGEFNVAFPTCIKNISIILSTDTVNSLREAGFNVSSDNDGNIIVSWKVV